MVAARYTKRRDEAQRRAALIRESLEAGRLDAELEAPDDADSEDAEEA